MRTIPVEPLTREAFEPFGDVIEIHDDGHDYPINGGTTQRFNDLATCVALGEESYVSISLARAQSFSLPLALTMLERHPEGSQAFIPLSPSRFLVTVALDHGGKPGTPRAFLAAPGQGINYFVNTWHAVLTALDKPTDFLIVDRQGMGPNLEVHQFEEPWTISND